MEEGTAVLFQVVFAGKAHPLDSPGKQVLRQIAELRHHPQLAGKVVFVEDYNINVARHLVQGVDVWLNNPRRPLEASGTSGQKVVLNGGLNLSVLDGWWAEAYDGSNGFAIGFGETHSSPGVHAGRHLQRHEMLMGKPVGARSESEGYSPALAYAAGSDKKLLSRCSSGPRRCR
jgi:alpha-glucan phosphorylase-like protein